MSKIAILNKTAPYGQANGQESLDLALAAGSFGQQISLFFIADGVFQLLAHQSPAGLEQKNYSKTFAALPFYDIDDIYVCADSLKQRALSPDDLVIDVQLVDPQKIRALLDQHPHVLSF